MKNTIKNASLKQLKLLHANVDNISPRLLEQWIAWADGEYTWGNPDLDFMIETIMKFPIKY